MLKWFKLPEIQACIAFYVFFLGCLLVQNRVVPRGKNSIFTIAKIVKCPSGNTKQKIFTIVDGVWITENVRILGGAGN